MLNVLKWDAHKNMQLLRRPVDKDKWATEPAVVNAFYNPNKNDIGKFRGVAIKFWRSFICLVIELMMICRYFQFFQREYYNLHFTVKSFQNL